MRVPALVATLLIGGALSPSCQCAPPRAARTYADLRVEVDVDGGTLVVTHASGGAPLLSLRPADIRAFDHDVFFDMQFGMFDIQEIGAPTNDRRGATFSFAGDAPGADAEDGDEPLALVVSDDAGELATLSARAARGGLELTIEAAADVVEVTSPCGFAHAIGLGAQTHDVDHVGQTVPLWVSEQGIGKTDTDELPDAWVLIGRRHTTHIPIPAFVTDARTSFVLDTTAFSEIDVCKDDALRMEVWDGRFTLRVFGGDSVRASQAKMVDAIGRPPLPAPWMHGVWVDAIFGSDGVRERMLALRAAEIPVSALWSEDWRGGEATSPEQYRLDEDWRLDRDDYPDFEALLEEMRALGMVSQVYFNTFLTESGDVFDEAVEANAVIQDERGAPYLFAGPDREFSPTALADLSGPRGRSYVKEHLTDALALGARGWMADYAEWMPVEGAVLESGEDPALVHNHYPVWWQEVNLEALEEAGRLEDSIIFVRSGHLGSQAVTQVVWAGDQRTTFDVDDGLPTVLPIAIGLSAVGFPFVTHDVGGYQSNTNPPTSKELYLRWTSLGAFSPVMRTHHGTHAYVNWNLFSDEETTAHFKRMAEWHVRLYPYLRALAIDAVEVGGLPLWTPLPLLFPDDDVWGLMDEVMLGPSLLVAPVVTEGATRRDIVFPSARFASLFDDATVVDGPRTQAIDAPLTEIPVFVRAGGIVPTLAEPVDTLLADVDGLRDLDDTEGDRIVYVGAGADGAFTEASGARYTLTRGADAQPGSYEHTGDGDVSLGGATMTLEGHPATRITTVVVR